jgi:hypothetical protein
MIRISGLGITMLGSALLLAFMGCDSGGTTAAPGVGGGGNNTDTNVGTDTNVTVSTGGKINTTPATGGKVSTGAGGSGNTGNITSLGCTSTTLPTATGTLSVLSGYVTTGQLKGYGFAWKGDLSNASTCIIPTCGSTGCTPLFGSSALCATGDVTTDTSYNTVVGVGFNLNQAQAGGTGSEKTVAAPASVTVDATLSSDKGGAAARIQIVSGTGASAVNYCVESGTWTPGTPIPIGNFNTSCWDTAATGAMALTAGTQITSIDIVIPSSATDDRPFAACLTGVTFSG